MLETLAGLLRAAAYVATLAGAGCAFARATLNVADAQGRALAVGTIRASGLALCVVAPATFALFMSRLGGAWDAPTVLAVLEPPLGPALFAQFAGGAWLVLRAQRGDAVPAAAAAVSALAMAGHAATNGVATALGLAIHVGAMAWWVGGLWLLLASLGRSSRQTTSDLLTRFSRQAPIVVIGALTAGVATAGGIVHWTLDAASDYVLALGAKVSIAIALLCAAAFNRWYLSARARASVRFANALRRSIVLELALVTTALGVTAWLTTHLMPPEPAEPRARYADGERRCNSRGVARDAGGRSRRVLVSDRWTLESPYGDLQWVMGWADSCEHEFNTAAGVIEPDWWMLELGMDSDTSTFR